MMQSIGSSVRKISHSILSAKPRLDPEVALKLLMQHPNWEEQIRKYYKSQKEAGSLSKAIPLALAIFTLAQQTGATSAEELISDVKEKAEQVQVQDIIPSDIQKMKTYIPFPVSEFELRSLKNPLIPVPFKLFEKSLRGKIEESLKKEVFPAIKKDLRFSQMSPKTISDLILKSFMAKIEEPKHSKAKEILIKYLGGESNLSKVKNIAQQTIQSEVNTALR